MIDRDQKKSVEISPDCPENYTGDILTRDLLLGVNNRKEVDTVAIVIAGWNNVVRGKDRHTGLFDMKLKQLEILGHKYVVVSKVLNKLANFKIQLKNVCNSILDLLA